MSKTDRKSENKIIRNENFGSKKSIPGKHALKQISNRHKCLSAKEEANDNQQKKSLLKKNLDPSSSCKHSIQDSVINTENSCVSQSYQNQQALSNVLIKEQLDIDNIYAETDQKRFFKKYKSDEIHQYQLKNQSSEGKHLNQMSLAGLKKRQSSIEESRKSNNNRTSKSIKNVDNLGLESNNKIKIMNILQNSKYYANQSIKRQKQDASYVNQSIKEQKQNAIQNNNCQIQFTRQLSSNFTNNKLPSRQSKQTAIPNSNHKISSKQKYFQHQTSKMKLSQQKYRKTVQNYDWQIAQLPQSYLIAMEQMQEKLANYDLQLAEMRQQLLNQERQKLQYEEKINYLLKQQHHMEKNNQNLLVQNRQLKMAIKEVRLSGNNLTQQKRQRVKLHHQDYIAQKDNAKTITFNTQAVRQNQNHSKQFIKQETNHIEQQSLKNEKKIEDHFYRQNTTNERCTSRTAYSSSSAHLNKYRQIIRLEKELVALKYRQQCIDRKLLQENNRNIRQQLASKLEKTCKEIKATNEQIRQLKIQCN